MSKDKLSMYEYDDEHKQYRRRGGDVIKAGNGPLASDIYQSDTFATGKGESYKGKRQKAPVSARASKTFFWILFLVLFFGWVLFMYKGFIEDRGNTEASELIIPKLSQE